MSKKTTDRDTTIEDIHRTRRRIAETFNGDIDAILEDARQRSNWMNLKYFPNVHNDGADVCYACTYPSSGTCTGAWEGQGDIRFFPSSFERNPTQYVLINLLVELPVLEVTLARLVKWEPMMALDRQPRVLK